ncbi:MAG TPA: CpsD/CapB family tyrosine-protein kinase [Enorma massiliensis]|uniref:CpsD/CapB family tyrosine-protein kinase n=1 Tax=Enorma massiliensis TaxID=1472761 RepID=UPI001D619E53|nr:CpsD/CapB family tyrosine-protein kinase [Enorma massiliensis]HJG61760.1 CpsD/CapB family tyrosine-protein kinase [Enorma massiliensis]
MPRKKKASSDALVVQNAAKTLLANIRFASVDRPVKSIVLTSSVPNEGKSTVAYNLAQAIASSGKRTLIVECDMRRRSLADMVGARARHGIYAVLSGQVELDEALVATSHRNLFFLDSEPHIPNPADILSSQRFRKLVAQMESDFDYVVIDTPPVGTFVDAAIIAALADATALVVRERFVKRAELQNAYDQLKKADANVIGVIMNMCEAESSEYYYAYYNKEGKRVRKSEGHVSDGPQLPQQRGSVVEVRDEPVVPATPARQQRPAQKKVSPSETAAFTAAAAASASAQAVKPVDVHRAGQATSNRFSRK